MKILLAAIHLFSSGSSGGAVSGGGLVSLIVWLVIAGLIFWLATWALGQLGLPEPFNKIIKVILVLIVFIIVLNALLGLGGHQFIAW